MSRFVEAHWHWLLAIGQAFVWNGEDALVGAGGPAGEEDIDALMDGINRINRINRSNDGCRGADGYEAEKC